MPRDIERAIKIASIAHAGQVDKNGQPYILHPLAVAMRFRFDKKRFIAAILHDVIEDTHMDLNDLIEEGIDEDIVEVVAFLTRDPLNESYVKFIDRLADSNNIDAIAVKIADIEDNLSRMSSLDAETAKYLSARYNKALPRLKLLVGEI